MCWSDYPGRGPMARPSLAWWPLLALTGCAKPSAYGFDQQAADQAAAQQRDDAWNARVRATSDYCTAKIGASPDGPWTVAEFEAIVDCGTRVLGVPNPLKAAPVQQTPAPMQSQLPASRFPECNQYTDISARMQCEQNVISATALQLQNCG